MNSRIHMNKLVFLASLCLLLTTRSFAKDENCRLTEGINVIIAKRVLNICEDGNVIREFSVAIGTRGTSKKFTGDRKTPLGLYELAAPRPSSRFGTFIPILYPNHQQVVLGYAGNNLGIHGPFQLLRWLGQLNTWMNWTQGCIALGKNDQMAFVTQWVKEHPHAKILIS